MTDNLDKAESANMDTVAETNLPKDPKTDVAKKVARFGGIISLVLSLIASIAIVSSPKSESLNWDQVLSDSSSLQSSNSGFDESWLPSGFSSWTLDSNIAWKWSSSNNCDQYTCVTAEFISRDGCPSGLYAAVNWLDQPVNSGGSVIGYDNATLPSLPSMQIAKLTFEDYNDVAKSAQMSELNCR